MEGKSPESGDAGGHSDQPGAHSAQSEAMHLGALAAGQSGLLSSRLIDIIRIRESKGHSQESQEGANPEQKK